MTMTTRCIYSYSQFVLCVVLCILTVDGSISTETSRRQISYPWVTEQQESCILLRQYQVHDRAATTITNKEEVLDVTAVDTTLMPDYWNETIGQAIDPRIATNSADPPEQLVKVTDRRHRHPVFATICSLAFLATIVGIIIVCTN